MSPDARKAARQAKVLFDKYGWKWYGDYTPTVNAIERQFRDFHNEVDAYNDGEMHALTSGRLVVVKYPNGPVRYGVDVG